jgi:hypothetical protein
MRHRMAVAVPSTVILYQLGSELDITAAGLLSGEGTIILEGERLRFRDNGGGIVGRDIGVDTAHRCSSVSDIPTSESEGPCASEEFQPLTRSCAVVSSEDRESSPEYRGTMGEGTLLISPIPLSSISFGRLRGASLLGSLWPSSRPFSGGWRSSGPRN